MICNLPLYLVPGKPLGLKVHLQLKHAASRLYYVRTTATYSCYILAATSFLFVLSAG